MRYMGTERPQMQPTTSTTTTTTHTTPAIVKQVRKSRVSQSSLRYLKSPLNPLQIRVQQFRTADTHYVAAGDMIDFTDGISMAYAANGGNGLARRYEVGNCDSVSRLNWTQYKSRSLESK